MAKKQRLVPFVIRITLLVTASVNLIPSHGMAGHTDVPDPEECLDHSVHDFEWNKQIRDPVSGIALKFVNGCLHDISVTYCVEQRHQKITSDYGLIVRTKSVWRKTRVRRVDIPSRTNGKNEIVIGTGTRKMTIRTEASKYRLHYCADWLDPVRQRSYGHVKCRHNKDRDGRPAPRPTRCY